MSSRATLQGLKEEAQLLLHQDKARKNKISLLRLLFFLLACGLFYYYLATEQKWWLGVSIACFAAFFLLIFASAYFQDKIDFHLARLKVIADCAKDFMVGKTAPPQVAEHFYAKDLDLFGERSLFSKINKNQSFLGEQRLREMLLEPLLAPQKIEKQQESIQELAENLPWNITFLASLHLLDLEKPQKLFLENFKAEAVGNLLNFVLKILPLIYLGCLGWALYLGNYVLGAGTLLVMVGVSYGLAHRYDERIGSVSELAEGAAKQYAGFVKVFKYVEEAPFNKEANLKLKHAFTDLQASKAIKKLARQVKNLENGQASYFGFVLNLFFFWNLRYTLKTEKILKDFQEKIPQWISCVAQLEALVSMAIYAHKNPQFIYPKASLSAGALRFEDLHHPLISAEQSVGNTFEIGYAQEVAIVTGANMTGKSTFLRTFGANLVLAMNGLPVKAKMFYYRPMRLFTSMRTTDSLSENNSYFQAEVLRLREIKETLEEGIPLYIILDEILKGTNSTDKLQGSRRFLEKMMSLETPFSCLVATHDLELTRLAEENPEKVFNYCFELHREENALISNYKLNPGKATQMNALYLMRKNGIID